MPVRIILKCGRELFFPNDSYAGLVAGSIMGVIKLTDGEGDTGFLTKSEIAYAKQIDPAKYNAQIEAQKKATEEQAAADAAAKEKAQADEEAKKVKEKLAALAARKPMNRLRRLVGLKPKDVHAS